MKSYQEILDYNREWAARKAEQFPNYFNQLSETQTPNFLFIGCSDSRISASEIMGVDAGEVFMHRNIANLVISTDNNTNSVINYAVRYLKVKEIIVCGHYGCGGVNAAMQSEDFGELNGWLRTIRDVFRLHKNELTKIEDTEQRYRRLVELNVYEQCCSVIKAATVQKSFLETKYPIVHGWVFDMQTGLINDLDIDFEGILREIQEIYNLTGKPLAKQKTFE